VHWLSSFRHLFRREPVAFAIGWSTVQELWRDSPWRGIGGLKSRARN